MFTGRTDTPRQLREGLIAASVLASNPQRRPAVQLIHGTGGIGKTRVTVEYAHAHAADYTVLDDLKAAIEAQLPIADIPTASD